jgi:hypothetical protein
VVNVLGECLALAPVSFKGYLYVYEDECSHTKAHSNSEEKTLQSIMNIIKKAIYQTT